MTRLFLDDNRKPSVVSTYCLPDLIPMYNDLWETVKSYDEFVNWINKNGLPDVISFDHDLEDAHYSFAGDYNDLERTGYHAAKWLVDYCIDNKVKLPQCYVHTMNPVGWDNIYNYLENYKKHEAK